MIDADLRAAGTAARLLVTACPAGHLEVRVHGEFDAAAADALDDAIVGGLTPDVTQVCVDLTRARSVSVPGLDRLAATGRAVRQAGGHLFVVVARNSMAACLIGIPRLEVTLDATARPLAGATFVDEPAHFGLCGCQASAALGPLFPPGA